MIEKEGSFETTKKTLKFMLKQAYSKKPKIFFFYFLKLVNLVLSKFILIILPKYVIDELVLIIQGQPLSVHLNRTLIFVGVSIGIQILINIIDSVVRRMINTYNVWFNQDFEVMIASHVMDLDYELTEDPDCLYQLQKTKEGIGWYSGGVIGILDNFFNVVGSIIVVIGILVLILINCPLLIPIQILALFGMSFVQFKMNKLEFKFFKDSSRINRVFGYIYWTLSDFSYGKDIRLYSGSKMFARKAKFHADELIGVFHSQSSAFIPYRIVNTILDGIKISASYFYVGLLALRKLISIGDFSMFMSASSNLSEGLWGILYGFEEIHKRSNYAYEYIKFFDYPQVQPQGTKAILYEKDGSVKKDHVIEFINVSFKYPRAENYVLKNINIKIQPGEHLAVVGLNGAGKTTFVKLLCRLYDVTEGEIKIDGVNIKEYSREEYKKLFAVLFQDFKLFAFTLQENISFGADVEKNEIDEILKLSGLYDDVQKMEFGTDTIIFKYFDKKGIELSGGQKQKTAISRALYKNAPIIILDEPTAALDPIAEYEIYKQFDNLIGGKTAVYISHRLSSCKFCDKIAVFSEGTIKEYGSHNQLLDNKDGIYFEMYKTQSKYYLEDSKYVEESI